MKKNKIKQIKSLLQIRFTISAEFIITLKYITLDTNWLDPKLLEVRILIFQLKMS